MQAVPSAVGPIALKSARTVTDHFIDLVSLEKRRLSTMTEHVWSQDKARILGILLRRLSSLIGSVLTSSAPFAGRRCQVGDASFTFLLLFFLSPGAPIHPYGHMCRDGNVFYRSHSEQLAGVARRRYRLR